MDMKLFEDDSVAVQAATRNAFIPVAVAPAVTAERFAEWPEHMRREFALLTAEKAASLADAAIARQTGITAEALARARATTTLHALSYSDVAVIDEDTVRISANKKRWSKKRRGSDA